MAPWGEKLVILGRLEEVDLVVPVHHMPVVVGKRGVGSPPRRGGNAGAPGNTAKMVKSGQVGEYFEI